MSEQQAKLTRAEVEQLLERAKAVPSISFGYIRLAEDCLMYMDALKTAITWLENDVDPIPGPSDGNERKLIAILKAVLPASEEATDVS